MNIGRNRNILAIFSVMAALFFMPVSVSAQSSTQAVGEQSASSTVAAHGILKTASDFSRSVTNRANSAVARIAQTDISGIVAPIKTAYASAVSGYSSAVQSVSAAGSQSASAWNSGVNDTLSSVYGYVVNKTADFFSLFYRNAAAPVAQFSAATSSSGAADLSSAAHSDPTSAAAPKASSPKGPDVSQVSTGSIAERAPSVPVAPQSVNSAELSNAAGLYSIVSNLLVRVGALESAPRGAVNNITNNYTYSNSNSSGSSYSAPAYSSSFSGIADSVGRVLDGFKTNTMIPAINGAISDAIASGSFGSSGTSTVVVGTSTVSTSSVRAMISSSVPGVSYSSSTGAFTLDSGYSIPLVASTTEWANAAASISSLSSSVSTLSASTSALWASSSLFSSFYLTPSSRIAAGSGLSWSGNTLANSGVLSIGGLTGAVSTSSLGLVKYSDLSGYLTTNGNGSGLTALNASNIASGVLAVNRGGTGTTTVPSFGQVLVGDGLGGYMLVATSSLGISGGTPSQWLTSGSDISYALGNVNIGTTTGDQMLNVAGGISAVGNFNIKGDNSSSAHIDLADDINGYAGMDITSYQTSGSPYSYLNLVGSRGTIDSPSQLLSGDSLGEFNFYGVDNIGSSVLGARISSIAENDFTSSPSANLIFSTNNAERMRISGNGSVGIGTDGPLGKLQVEGGAIYANAPESDSVVNGGAGNDWQTYANIVGTAGLWAIRTDTSGGVNFDVNNTFSPINALHIGQDGNVGIGSQYPGGGSSASRYLTIASPSGNGNTAAIELQGYSSTDLAPVGMLSFTNGNGNSELSRIESYIQGNTGTGGLRFLTGTTGSLNTSLLIGPDGKIGIGTTTPGYALTVSGDANLTGALRANGSAGTAGMVLLSNGASAPTWVATSSLGISGGGTNYWTLAGANLYNNSGTNIGIGTTTPAFPLTVAGNAFVGGSITVGSVISTSTATSSFAGDIRIAGSILPTADDVYDLGAPDLKFRNLYLGAHSLYINGQEVLQAQTGKIVVSADLNQTLSMQTSGTGDVEFNPTGSGQVLLKGNTRVSAGYHFNMSDGSAVPFTGGVAADNLSLIGNTLAATNLNGGISIAATGTGGVYFTRGNVGIGTTTPGYALTVAGDANLTGALRANGSAGTAGMVLLSNGASAPTWVATSSLGISGGAGLSGGAAGSVARWTSASALSTGLLLDDGTVSGVNATSSSYTFNIQGSGGVNPFNVASSSGTSLFAVLASGNVGIGTTSPAATFAVSGSALVTSSVTAQSINTTGGGSLNTINGTLYVPSELRIGTGASGGCSTVTCISSLGASSIVLAIKGAASQTGDLTRWISSAGTTLSAVNASGSFVIGTSTAWAKMSIQQAYGGAAPLFDIASTTSSGFATSSMFIVLANGNVGVASSSPYARLTVTGEAYADLFTAGSSTATSTFAGGLNVGNGALTYSWASGVTNISNATLGAMTFDTDSGMVSWVDMPVTSASASGTVESYTAQLGGNPVLSVYGLSNGAGGVNTLRVGIGTTTPVSALSVVGTINATNLIGGASLSADASGNIILTPSDERLKQDITPIGGALDKVMKLQGVTFDWKDKERFGSSTEIGFIAQDVQKVVPEVVRQGPEYMSLNYANMVALVVEAVKELKSQFDSLVSSLNGVLGWFSQSGDRLNVKGMICVDEVCVTKDQFKQMLMTSGSVTLTAPEASWSLGSLTSSSTSSGTDSGAGAATGSSTESAGDGGSSSASSMDSGSSSGASGESASSSASTSDAGSSGATSSSTESMSGETSSASDADPLAAGTDETASSASSTSGSDVTPAQ